MSLEDLDANSEYRRVLLLYREHFNLTQKEVAKIAGVKQSEYSGFETGKRFLYLNDADNISLKVWGKKYNEFTKNVGTYPTVDHLPVRTQQVIEQRKLSGSKLRDTESKLAKALDQLIEIGQLNEPITAKNIWELLPIETREESIPIEITNLFNKAPRSEIIAKVGKTGREFLFQLKEFAKK